MHGATQQACSIRLWGTSPHRRIVQALLLGPVSAGQVTVAAVVLLGVGFVFAPASVRAQDLAASRPMLTLPPTEVVAPPEPRRRTIGGEGPPPCVQVDIAGHRAGHLDCATAALERAAETARRDTDAAHRIPVAGAGSPDVEVGVASRAGTRLRLRENFGASIRPPMAAPPVVTHPGGARE